MFRRIVTIAAAITLPLLLAETVGSESAVASPILPGSVTCSGNWSGTIHFTPALKNGGVSPKEKMKIVATLGNTAKPCVTTAGTIELGAINGTLGFVFPGANNCTTIFSGAPLPAPVAASKLKMTWTAPPGAPTVWKQPPAFSVTGAVGLTDIAIVGGALTAGSSFPAPPPPNATLSDAGWPAAIAGACASVAGLSSLTLGTSSGTW
ncbi:MAG TPA: hypothetical protein VEJ87_01560 [Acidimicrobiales bacterium]|nr:hypothetical protein [Acidimicrobiales bacterium]